MIVVDDSSPGDAEIIVSEYMSNDSRIKYIKHENNKGLFHARITVKWLRVIIAFVDSDDYVSIDYFRLLINKALDEGSI